MAAATQWRTTLTHWQAAPWRAQRSHTGSRLSTRPSPAASAAQARPSCAAAAAAAAAAAGLPGRHTPGRRSVLHQLAASAALLLANAAGPACQPAAASAAADGAERVATSCRGCVAAISAIASGKTAALGEQQLGCGVLWGSDGYVVVPYAPLTRLSRQGTAGDPQVLLAEPSDPPLHCCIPAALPWVRRRSQLHVQCLRGHRPGGTWQLS